MKLLVYPVAAPQGELRVWVGVSSATSAPALTWQLNGESVDPIADREMSSVRSGDLLGNAAEPRAFTGLYRFTARSGANSVSVSAPGFGTRILKNLRTIPDSIPADGLHVFLSSCFHVQEAEGGKLDLAVNSLKSRCRPGKKPHFSILMGDQVYLDLPTVEDLPSKKIPLARILEARYLKNWQGAKSFDEVLQAAPFFAMSDDHEFWNNYPHRSPIIQNSWSRTGRDNWAAASKAMFCGFQSATPKTPEKPVRVDLDEVSFLMVDTRYERTNNTFMPPGGIHDLEDWVDDLNRNKRVGVLVTGQSLYSKPAGNLTGSVADFEYPDYDDFSSVVKPLTHLRQPLICVTGDVHWGRVIESVSQFPERRGNVYEIITSPSSLVTSVGVDQVKKTKNFFSGLFGGSSNSSKWPRHNDPPIKSKDIDTFPNNNDGWFTSPLISPKPYEHKVRAALKGNQMALLTFERSAGQRISAIVRYWTIDGRTTSPAATVRLFDYRRP